jgi:hypothetical protein
MADQRPSGTRLLEQHAGTSLRPIDPNDVRTAVDTCTVMTARAGDTWDLAGTVGVSQHQYIELTVYLEKSFAALVRPGKRSGA